MSLGLKKVNEYLKENQLDAILVSKPENCRYISGFSGSAGVLFVSSKRACLLTDFRYVEQAQAQAPEFEIIRFTGTPFEALTQLYLDNECRHIGFEGDHLTWDMHRRIIKCFSDAQLVSVSLDSLRTIKTDEEISLIQKAVEIADKAFSEVLGYIRPGLKESDVAAELEYAMRRLGSERPAFATIVASGSRGALPHGLASSKLIERGELVTMDFGAVYQGYHSDITRTVAIGSISQKHKDVYNLVLRAQLAGIEAVSSGKDCSAVDETARSIIREAGFGDCFGHGLGHCVGLAIHEEPRLSPSAAGSTLAAGMAVTVEPGIYIPGWGGVRIEDLVVVTSSGRNILTASSKALIEID